MEENLGLNEFERFYGRDYCVRVSLNLEKQRVEEFQGNIFRFREGWVKPTVALLLRLTELGFPLRTRDHIVVHLCCPLEKMALGEVYFQVGRKLPGRLSMKFTRSSADGNIVIQPTVLEPREEEELATVPAQFLDRLRWAAMNQQPEANKMLRTLVVVTPQCELRQLDASFYLTKLQEQAFSSRMSQHSMSTASGLSNSCSSYPMSTRMSYPHEPQTTSFMANRDVKVYIKTDFTVNGQGRNRSGSDGTIAYSQWNPPHSHYFRGVSEPEENEDPTAENPGVATGGGNVAGSGATQSLDKQQISMEETQRERAATVATMEYLGTSNGVEATYPSGHQTFEAIQQRRLANSITTKTGYVTTKSAVAGPGPTPTQAQAHPPPPTRCQSEIVPNRTDELEGYMGVERGLLSMHVSASSATLNGGLIAEGQLEHQRSNELWRLPTKPTDFENREYDTWRQKEGMRQGPDDGGYTDTRRAFASGGAEQFGGSSPVLTSLNYSLRNGLPQQRQLQPQNQDFPENYKSSELPYPVAEINRASKANNDEKAQQ